MKGTGFSSTEPSLRGVLDDIEAGRPAQVYLIHGEDDFSVQDSLAKIIGKILPEPSEGLNLIYFDGEENIRGICEELLTPSLFTGVKIVVLRNTGLFRSKSSPAEIFLKAVAALENDPGRALRLFHSFLKAAGLRWEDVAGGSWKNITEKEWRKFLGDDYSELVPVVPVFAGLAADAENSVAEEGGSAEDLSEVLKNGMPDGNCLIMTAGAVDQRKALFKYIAENGIVLAHAVPRYERGKAAQFANAVRGHVELNGKRIAPDALAALGAGTGYDVRTAITEIEKVISYIGGRNTIEPGDIEEAAGKSIADPAFRLNACVQEKDLNGALETLRDMLEKNDPPLKMLAMMIRELRFLLQAKIILNSGIINSYRHGMEYSGFQNSAYPEIKAGRQEGIVLAELAGQHPFVIYSALKNSTRFSYEKLLKDLNYLLDVDMAFKSTGIDQRTALETALMRICS